MSSRTEWLISVDDHVIEPADLWVNRLPSKYKDIGPRLVREGNYDVWLYEGRRKPVSGLAAVAGKKREEFSPEAIGYDDMRPGCYDPHERVQDMNIAKTLGSLCFPSFPRFCGQEFFEAEDRELALLCVRAWNDWMIEEWHGAAPGRLMALSLIPLWDPLLAEAEMERMAERGCHGFAFSENPSKLKDAKGDFLPSIHDPGRHWDPVFRAAEQTGLPLCIHYGSSSQNPKTSEDAPYIVNFPVNSITLPLATTTDWIFSGNLHRFPGLNVCMSEGQIGWIAPLLERCEQVYDKQRHWGPRLKEQIEVGGMSGTHSGFKLEDERRPTEIFRDQMYSCFYEDFVGVRTVADPDLLDNILIETDYPHSDSTWPDSGEVAVRQLEPLTDDQVYKVMQGNAIRIHHFTPDQVPEVLADGVHA